MELVTHCFHYDRLLRYHLSRLVLWPPRELKLKATVCFTPKDFATAEVLAWFGKRVVEGVTWNWQPMDSRELCRRSIGRNRAALATEADWIWFCDVDYWFAAECWTSFAALPPTAQIADLSTRSPNAQMASAR